MFNRNRQNRRVVKRQRLSVLPWVLAALFLSALVMTSCWAWQRLQDPRTLPFHQVRLVGDFHYLNQRQLEPLIQSHINGGFFAIDLVALKQAVLKMPWVQTVTIRRVPGTLVVHIYEQKPLARWNQQQLINEQGELFSVPDKLSSDLPLLQGPENSQAVVLTEFWKINELFKLLGAQVSELRLGNHENWSFMLDNGIAVTVGSEDIDKRIDRLAQWYSKVIGDKSASIKHIDLRYPSGFAVQRNP